MRSEKTADERSLERMLKHAQKGGCTDSTLMRRLHYEAFEDGYEIGHDDGFDAGCEMGRRDERNGH